MTEEQWACASLPLGRPRGREGDPPKKAVLERKRGSWVSHCQGEGQATDVEM